MKKIIFLILLSLLIYNIYQVTEENIIIPDTSIRLRVVPNSNSPEDIYIKEKVKAYLEKDIYKLTKNVSSISEARNIINESIPTIKNNIDNIFLNNKYSLDYKINYGSNYFPKKTYKGIDYSEGYYESLVIYIGESNGDNWWCVLYPNLCLIDSKENYEYRSYFKHLINKYSKK